MATRGENSKQIAEQRCHAGVFFECCHRIVDQPFGHPLDERAAHAIAAAEVVNQRRVADPGFTGYTYDMQSFQAQRGEAAFGRVENQGACFFRRPPFSLVDIHVDTVIIYMLVDKDRLK